MFGKDLIPPERTKDKWFCQSNVSVYVTVRDYVVRTMTGDGFGSGTDAAVYINIIGTLGDSGKRYLTYNLEETDNKFESGQVNNFNFFTCQVSFKPYVYPLINKPYSYHCG